MWCCGCAAELPKNVVPSTPLKATRVRMNEQASSSWMIGSYKNYNMVVTERDPAVIGDVATATFHIAEWISKLAIADLESLTASIIKYERTPVYDTAIRAYGQHLAEVRELED